LGFFESMEIKNCFICKLSINEKKDSYVEIKEFNDGEFYKSLFAHKVCWLNHLSSKALLLKANANLDRVMGGILNG